MRGRNQYSDPYYRPRQNSFDNLNTLEFVPQYMGLPLQEIDDTGNAFYTNYTNFQIGKSAIENSMESFLNEVNGADKETAERIMADAQSRIEDIADKQDFSSMGMDIVSLSNQYKARAMPLMAEAQKVAEQRKIIMGRSDLMQEDRDLMLEELERNARNSALKYEPGTFKIIGGGFTAGSPLNPVDPHDVVMKALAGVSADAWGVTFSRAMDIANNQIGLQKDFISYLDHRSKLLGDNLRDKLKAQGNLSDSEIEKIVADTTSQKKEELIDVVRQQIVDKLTRNEMGFDKSGSTGSGRTSAGKEGFKRAEVAEQITGTGRTIESFKELDTFIENAEKGLENLEERYKHIKRKEDGQVRFVEKVGDREYDRTHEYEREKHKYEAQKAEYQGIKDLAWNQTVDHFKITKGIDITEEDIQVMPESVGSNPYGNYNPRITKGMIRGDSVEVSRKFNEFVKKVSEETMETVIGLAIYDEQTGEIHTQDRALANTLNEKMTSLALVDLYGNQDDKAMSKFRDPSKYKFNPSSRIYNVRTGEFYTVANVEQKNGTSWVPTKNTVIIKNNEWWESQMSNYEVMSTSLLAHTHTLMPKKHETSKVLEQKDFEREFGKGSLDEIAGIKYNIDVLRDNSYAVSISDVEGYDIFPSIHNVRTHIHADIMRRVDERAQERIAELAGPDNSVAFDRRRIVSNNSLNTSEEQRSVENIDFYIKSSASPIITSFLLGVEGFKNNGYVPVNNGKVIGKSGVTIGIGVDLGQQSLEDLKNVKKVPKSILDKIEPYIGRKGEDAKDFLAKNPLTLAKDEALTLSSKLEDWYSDTLSRTYGHYGTLPEEAKAVVLSLSYQNGITGARNEYSDILDNIFKGKYDIAANLLEQTSEYKTRRKQEAGLLRSLTR